MILLILRIVLAVLGIGLFCAIGFGMAKYGFGSNQNSNYPHHPRCQCGRPACTK